MLLKNTNDLRDSLINLKERQEAQLAQVEAVVKKSTMSCLRAMLELKDLDMPTHFLFLPYDDALAQSGGHEVMLDFFSVHPSIPLSHVHAHTSALCMSTLHQ